jgi:hypothetical protein
MEKHWIIGRGGPTEGRGLGQGVQGQVPHLALDLDRQPQFSKSNKDAQTGMKNYYGKKRDS